jgi:predicted lactoylglutathione lyase
MAPSPPQIRLDQLNLVVSDVSASRAFYTRLGVEFESTDDELWQHHHISAPHGERLPLDVDLDSTSFAPKWNAGWNGAPGVILGFKVATRPEVDELVAELAVAGATVQQEPFDAFWGARYAVVSDPDGIGVGIMSPVDPAMRRQSPDPR